MIAFDLDGIFLPDIHFDTEEQLSQLLHVRSRHLSPILLPTMPYYLITGRPLQDKPDTDFWINEFFPKQNRPGIIFHDNHDIDNAITYKASVLSDNPEIDIFVESDASQVTALRGLVNCRIEHFGEFVNRALQTLQNEN
jgi:hypothetical protein